MQLFTDPIVEGDEDFFLRLSSTDPLLGLDPARDEATVIINDITSMFLVFTLDILIMGILLQVFLSNIMKQFIIQGLK